GLGLGAGESLAPSPQPPAPDAYSQLILTELERMNLFLVPLDDIRGWYRYHHLFAEVLRERLQSGATAEEIAILHRRASEWFDRNGLAVEAIHHALVAPDVRQAAELIERNAEAVLKRG